MKLPLLLLSLLVLSFGTSTLLAQNPVLRRLPVDTAVITKHSISIKGQRVAYTAEVGMQPLWDEAGKPIASLHYTYYTRDGQSDSAKRPLLISFNGGPGSASVWMHIAYTGPKLLSVDDEGYPLQPYGLRDNPHSILDVADVVFVNPVNTGYSRLVPDKEGKTADRDKFFGINADINYLAEWLSTFMSRKDRWLSPKYIIGESYGGTRVMGLAGALQERQWMYLNGVIMVSPADYKFFDSDPPIANALELPYMTAAAHYHKMLSPKLQALSLEEVLAKAEAFALDTLMPAVARGSSLSAKQKTDVAARFAMYSGLTPAAVMSQNLQVPTNFFWKELLRERDTMTIGRLDSRYLGMDRAMAGSGPDYNAELTSWLHSFTPGINHYFATDLKFPTDVKYNMFGNVYPWDNTNNNVREQLREAMAANPYLHVMVQAGYYDGATTYFNSKYTMWQLDPSGRLRDRMEFHGYKSGHMMYLRSEDLAKATDDIRAFIKKSTPLGSAKY